MSTETRSIDYYRAVIVGDFEKGEKDIESEPFEGEGEAFAAAAAAKLYLKNKNEVDPETGKNDVILQRSTLGPDGPWLRY